MQRQIFGSCQWSIKAQPLLHEAEAYQVPEWDSVGLMCWGMWGLVHVYSDAETLNFVHSGCLTSSKTLKLFALPQKDTLTAGKEAALRIGD